MDNFTLAVNEALKDEGGKTKDHAGLTNFGITMAGLLSLSIDLNGDGSINKKDIENMTREQAVRFFRKWWDKCNYSLIINERVACKIFNISINTGPYQIHLITQRACRSCGFKLIEDGIFGKKTIAAVNSINPDVFLPALRSEIAGFYRLLATKNPVKYGGFLNGWLENRAYD